MGIALLRLFLFKQFYEKWLNSCRDPKQLVQMNAVVSEVSLFFMAGIG